MAQDGVALVEFAVVAPLLMVLMLGLVEVGRYAYFGIVVANAARVGVQYGAQNGSTALDGSGISAAVRADSANGVANLQTASTDSCQCWNGSSYTSTSCSPTPKCSNGHPVEFVTVTTDGTARPLFNYPLLPGSITIKATATRRVSEQ